MLLRAWRRLLPWAGSLMEGGGGYPASGWRQRAAYYWTALRASMWFLPALIVLGAMLLAVLLIEASAELDSSLFAGWPRLFGAGAEGTRGMLEAIAGSMVTVTGVVFSITIVVLSLTSSQYAPRVLRNFVRDRINQTVLGVFLGIFAYCLLVLRTIRSGDGSGGFVPELAVIGAVLLALVGIGFLIGFIHHIVHSIQPAQILAEIAHETTATIDHLFPNDMAEDEREAAPVAGAPGAAERPWQPVPAARTGYVQLVGAQELVAFARKLDTVVRMDKAVGEFVVEGQPLCWIAAQEPPAAEQVSTINTIYSIDRERTIEQDPRYGIGQIVDLALRALSAAANDTASALMAVDYLSAILLRAAGRRIPSPYRYHEGRLRAIARGPCFGDLLADALDQLRRNARGNVVVLLRLAQVLDTLRLAVRGKGRRALLCQQAERLAEAAASVADPQDRAHVEGVCRALVLALAAWSREATTEEVSAVGPA